MIRHTLPVRENWQLKVEQLGFNYHTLSGETYWDESACYEFSYDQVAALEVATRNLYDLCLQAVDYVIQKELWSQFSIPLKFVPMIRTSWRNETPSIYGRFDLSWNGDLSVPPSMLEFNADTPTSLYEAAVAQWFWLRDIYPNADQFNSIHEKLIAWWKKIKPYLRGRRLYFSCLDEYPEDFMNVSYLQDCAEQAGLETLFVGIRDIGLKRNRFIDLNEKPIDTIFKLYPWEWMMHEEFGDALLKSPTTWIEPPWKMVLSNKAILPILWKLFPGHPNLLEAYFDHPGPLKDYAKKPILSREGANVTIVENEAVITETHGEYGYEGYVYQQLRKLPDFNGNHPVIGSWLIGGNAAGIGIRETGGLVTDNLSRFVPHYITQR